MILLYLAAFFGLASSSKIVVDPKVCPTCVVAYGACYNTTPTLKLVAPFSKSVVIHKMGILRSTNMLFYSFEPPFEDKEYYKIGFINLDNPDQAGVINIQNRISNFGTFDIDQDNEFVYMGGSDGIFVLDLKESTFAQYSSMGDTIRSIFFKTNVNFVMNENKGIIVKRGDSFKTLLENTFVKNFVINKYDVIVFLNNLGLFVGKGDVKLRLSKNAFFRGLLLDLDGVVYTWWIDSIYKVDVGKNPEESKIEKITTFPVAIGAMTFDNDNNILFTVKDMLYKVTPTDIGCKILQDKAELVRA